MMNYNPLLLIDFYKATHHEQYPVGLTKMVSYYTPRMSRLNDVDRVTLFGLQGFIKEYLIEGFNRNFFQRPLNEVVNEYNRILTYTLGAGSYEDQKIIDLHNLGYLPIEIQAVPEGKRTKVGVPQIMITNTHPNFVWLVNTIETLLSCTMWHTQVAAEMGYRYRKVIDKWVKMTCDESVDPRRMIGDFSMRGQHSAESATKASAAWLLSHYNTATVPAIMWLEQYYNCDCTKEPVGFGAISTEHSVMCSNFAVDGDEITHIKRLLTQIYPNHNFSMVSDSYDYERLVTELLPQCKAEIMAHNGTLLIRGDSGNPVEVLAGKNIGWLVDGEIDWDSSEAVVEWMQEYAFDNGMEGYEEKCYFAQDGQFFEVTITAEWTNERGAWTDNKHWYVEGYTITYKEIPASMELLGTVWALDQIVGHTYNDKGYMVLDSHLRAIYGDSIIPDYADEAYRRLAEQGYAANNIVMGAGSMSMMALVCQAEDGSLKFAGECNGTNPGPYTRDTFGIAVKATYAEDKDGNPINIFKQPKALSWKKSQKGCCIVALDGSSYTDEHTYADAHLIHAEENLFKTVFENGAMVKEYTLAEVRKNLHPEDK